MNFEQSMVVEFEQIPSLTEKVFPLYATEGIKPPFLIYISSEGEKTQTLDGYYQTKNIVCEIHVLTTNYADLKDLTKAVIDKILTFFGRNIGIGGPKIKFVGYDQPTEVFEKSVGYYRASFDLRVKI